MEPQHHHKIIWIVSILIVVIVVIIGVAMIVGKRNAETPVSMNNQPQPKSTKDVIADIMITPSAPVLTVSERQQVDSIMTTSNKVSTPADRAALIKMMGGK